MSKRAAPASDGAGQLGAEVVRAIRAAVGSHGRVPLHEPCFRGREWQYLKDCLDSGWVSAAGPYVTRFEQQLAAVTGAAHVVATASGTAALHTCLLVTGVSAGDEVLIPSLSFVATANAVAYTGAVPHFLDCDPVTFGIDPSRMEAHLTRIAGVRDGICRNRRTGRRIRAIVPVHLFGHPCRIDAVIDVAARFELTVIEDAAESLGSVYRECHTGRWGRLAAMSFNGNKTITTGGGGAVITDDERLAQLARHLTTTAKQLHRWEFRHDQLAYNYRMPAINAALGCAQLENLAAILASKRELARRYEQAFAEVDGVRFLTEPEGSRSNYWLCTVLLEDRVAEQRDRVLACTNDAGLATRPSWALLSELPMYAACPRADLRVSQNVARRLLNLPSSPGHYFDARG